MLKLPTRLQWLNGLEWQNWRNLTIWSNWRKSLGMEETGEMAELSKQAKRTKITEMNGKWLKFLI